MRFVFVPFVVLAASFTLANAQNKIDAMLKPPPPPTDVNVVNFPETQAVTGTVSVDNLPAVQTVGGTVNVGNLPLDADGAVRVTGAPAKQMVWYELLPGPMAVEPGAVDFPQIVNVDGFSSIGFSVSPARQDIGISFVSRWAPDDDFRAVADAKMGFSTYGAFECGGTARLRLVCPLTAVGDVRVMVYASTPTTLTSVRVYLFP